MTNKKAALHNLGCKVNSYETEAAAELLKADGYEIVPFEPGADVYIINTCSVTNIADRKSRQMLHRAKAMNKDAIVVAMGCYVQTGKEFYGLADALQDMYLCLKMDEAMSQPLTVVETKTQPWAGGK